MGDLVSKEAVLALVEKHAVSERKLICAKKPLLDAIRALPPAGQGEAEKLREALDGMQRAARVMHESAEHARAALNREGDSEG